MVRHLRSLVLVLKMKENLKVFVQPSIQRILLNVYNYPSHFFQLSSYLSHTKSQGSHVHRSNRCLQKQWVTMQENSELRNSIFFYNGNKYACPFLGRKTLSLSSKTIHYKNILKKIVQNKAQLVLYLQDMQKYKTSIENCLLKLVHPCLLHYHPIQYSVNISSYTTQLSMNKKQLQERSYIYFKNFSNTTEKQRITLQKGKEKSFILPASSIPLAQHCSVPRGNSLARKNSSCQERDSKVNYQVPQPFWTLHKGPASILPQEETGKAETYRYGQK